MRDDSGLADYLVTMTKGYKGGTSIEKYLSYYDIKTQQWIKNVTFSKEEFVEEIPGSNFEVSD